MNFLNSEMADDIEFIGSILKQNGFSNVKNITRLQSGSHSVAYYADDYVLRFPKDEIIWQTMKREKFLLDMIYPYLMPEFSEKIRTIDLAAGNYSFAYSRRFLGRICDGRPESEYAVLYQNLSTEQKENLACDIARFFNLMHSINYSKFIVPEPNETIDNWDVTLKENFDFETVREALLPYHIDLKDYETESRNEIKALCHNDLSGSNILLDTEKEDVLSGIIDFGNVRVMPKYQDFFPLYKIHRELATNVLKYYNKITGSPIEQKQIDFTALAYIGYGLSKNKDNTSIYFMKLLKPFLQS